MAIATPNQFTILLLAIGRFVQYVLACKRREHLMIKTTLKVIATTALTLALATVLLGAALDASLLSFTLACLTASNAAGLMTWMWG